MAVQQAAPGPICISGGRWFVIYKIKSIKDLRLDVINGDLLLSEARAPKIIKGRGVLSKDSKGDCVVLSFLTPSFFGVF